MGERSVRVPPGAHIAYVAIYIYCPWQDVPLAPFEVFLGIEPGRTDRGAVRCAGPVAHEPANGMATYIACGDLESGDSLGTWITVMQSGPVRGIFVNELCVYAPSPPATRPLALVKPKRDVVAEINTRFRNGQPSRRAAAAGVCVCTPTPSRLASRLASRSRSP